MLLAIDIGNSRIKFCVFGSDRTDPVNENSFATDRHANVETFSSEFSTLSVYPIRSAIISSVVPYADRSISNAIRRLFDIDPVFVSHENIPDLDIRHSPVNSIGSDRLVNAFAAKEKYGSPVIVCSLGTATTIDLVSLGNILAGGVIAPGLPVLSNALYAAAVKLPLVEPAPVTPTIQTTTEDAIRSGIFNGYVGMIRYLIAAVRTESATNSRVIATGGIAERVIEFVPEIDIVDRRLTLDGLRAIAGQSRN